MMDEQEYQELALEILDMLAVALHFAGAKPDRIKTLIDIYIREMDSVPEDEEFSQAMIIALINQIKATHPQHFQSQRT